MNALLVRVPLLIRWAGVAEPGSVTDAPAATMDVLPTLAKLIGAEPATADPMLRQLTLQASLAALDGPVPRPGGSGTAPEAARTYLLPVSGRVLTGTGELIPITETFAHPITTNPITTNPITTRSMS